MNLNIFAVFLMLVMNFRLCQSRRYDFFSLYSAVPTELHHLKFLQNLDKKKYMDVVFWKKPYKLYEDVQFIVNPIDKMHFIERANHFNLNVDLLQINIQEAFDNQIVRRYHRMRVETYTWQHYHSLEDIYQWLADITVKYPNIVELGSIGKSAQGREIYAMSIKRPESMQNVIVEGGIHGNEWLSTEFVTYLAYHLIHLYESPDPRLAEQGTKYAWFLVPVVNPDGYAYSHSEDRLWRKNRRNFGDVIGVDLNRNFDNSFGKYATSSDPKDDSYCGPSPFSEPETQALSEFVTRKAGKTKFYFAFHAYGQKIITPFADRVRHVMDNFPEMENYGKQAILKMYHMNGVKYGVGTTYDTLGTRISGDSASWVKKTHKVKYVFTFLLRDNGSYGYALPSTQIVPSCRETLSGMLEIMTARPKRIRLNLFGSFTSISRARNTFLIFCIFLIFVLQ